MLSPLIEQVIMLKNIPISELKPGMYVVDPSINWMQRPYLFAENRLISSEEEIQRIIADGYLEVFIDLARSDASVFTEGLPDNPILEVDKQQLRLTPKTSLEEELPKALKVHDESVLYARKFMSDMRTGKVSMSAAGDVVFNIMESLENNPDALLSLSRLHHKDSYTYTHCVNVSILSTFFSRFTGKDSDTVYAAGVAGLFHDLGKALVPQMILNAPRKLTQAEFTIMQRHPTLGYEQLCSVPGISQDVLLGALQHHERYDGSGYPKGLSAEEISPIGSILAVVDVYDALTSNRPYKGSMFPHKALGIMYQHMRAKELHPDYLARFIRMVGVYPTGSVVIIEGGWTGVVIAANQDNPSKPKVRLCIDPQGKKSTPWDCDLSQEGSPLITSCIAAEDTAIDLLQEMGLKPE